MKIFGFEITKIKKEKIIEIVCHENDYKEIRLSGDGWGILEQSEVGIELADLFNKLPSKLDVHEKVQVFELFFPELTVKIIEK